MQTITLQPLNGSGTADPLACRRDRDGLDRRLHGERLRQQASGRDRWTGDLRDGSGSRSRRPGRWSRPGHRRKRRLREPGRPGSTLARWQFGLVDGSYIGLELPTATVDAEYLGRGSTSFSANNTIRGLAHPTCDGRGQSNVISDNGTPCSQRETSSIQDAAWERPGTRSPTTTSGPTRRVTKKAIGNGSITGSRTIRRTERAEVRPSHRRTDSATNGPLGPVKSATSSRATCSAGRDCNHLGVHGSKTLIEGNFIGTDVTGLLPIPNGPSGATVSSGSVGICLNSNSNTIGGIVAGFGLDHQPGNVASPGNQRIRRRDNGEDATCDQHPDHGGQLHRGGGSNGTTDRIGNDGSGVFILAGGGETIGGTSTPFAENSPARGSAGNISSPTTA